MKKIALVFAGLIALASSAFAEQETCYELSSNGVAWSRTPELLCVTQVSGRDYSIVLKSGLPSSEREIAQFNLSLTQRARCFDCNEDIFSVANPSNSVFKALTIRFKGVADIEAGTASGIVSIGKNKFFYRSR